MRIPFRNPWLACCGIGGALAAALAADTVPFEAREAAYRDNNRGVALLEQFRHGDAAAAFRQALARDPSLTLARINLALALFNVPEVGEAEKEARAALTAAPDAPQLHFILGLIARGQNKAEEAKAAFRKVLAVDAEDVGALVNLGQVLMQQREYAEAASVFRTAVDAEPYSVTAVYNLGMALTRAGRADEGRRALERFQTLKDSGYGTVLGQTYPDQGRYGEALLSTGAEPDRVDPATPAVRFVDATASVLPAAADARASAFAPLLVDYDGDGDLDMVDVQPAGRRLYRNDGGRFADATRATGLDPAAGGRGALAGDLDGDGRPDLLIWDGRGLTLLRNGGPGFRDATAGSGLPAGAGDLGAAAFGDFDHDGDLDLVLGLAAGTIRLLRNDGTGRFTDATASAGLEGEASTVALVATDFDDRRDLDLLQAGQGVRLFRNLRDGRFLDVAKEARLPAAGRFTAVTAGDVNKDGATDFFLGVADGPDLVALGDGRGRFTVSPAPEGSRGSRAAQFLDYDNDGLLDLVTLSPNLRVVRNLGTGWTDVTKAAVAEADGGGAVAYAAGDLDGDGDTDLLLRLASGGLRLLRNDGGEKSRSLAVRLAGRVSNRGGVGAKLEMRAGSLRQKIETYAATPPPAPAGVVFGLGRRERADAVRVLWPAGILQTEILTEPKPRVDVEELDRKPSSCPYLYTWNGSAFAFVTDFMGGGEMGYWHAPGVWNTPDPEEYVRLTDDQLRPRDGRYQLRVTNELEEALFLDRLTLLAVDHPADVEVHPNEGMVGKPPALRLYAVGSLHPPSAALDDQGRDVLDRLAETDRRFVDGFALHRIRGYAEEHTLTLDLAEGDDVLLLTGWTDYAFSSDNVAAHQAGLTMRGPLLEVQDASGSWTDAGEVGIPVGRPQTVLVDLAGRWHGPSRRVRIVTNMRIYWDRARAGRALRGLSLRPATVPALAMDLRERGFSAEVTPDGREPFVYDYTRVSGDSPWKRLPGRYTRAGDVRELLSQTDDLFVISRPGDEVALSFDAGALAPVAAGRRRTFLLYADGYSKEMDINSATPDALGPLPFHGMSRYPYTAPEAYPMTPERAAVYERYNTRVVRGPAPSLDWVLAKRRYHGRGVIGE
jgi:Flp pilus assembly protein TadD